MSKPNNAVANLRDQIRRAMNDQGINQGGLAELIGASQGYVSGVLSGATNPGWRNVCRIADALGVAITTEVQ